MSEETQAILRRVYEDVRSKGNLDLESMRSSTPTKLGEIPPPSHKRCTVPKGSTSKRWGTAPLSLI